MNNLIFIFILILIVFVKLRRGDEDDDLLPTQPRTWYTTISPRKRCEGDIAIEGCTDVQSPSDDPNWNWHRRNKYVIRGALEAACHPSDYVFNWTLINANKTLPRNRRVVKLPQFWNHSLVILDEFMLDVGTWHVKLEVKQLSTNEDRYAYCLIKMTSCPPRAIIDLMYFKEFQRLSYEQRISAQDSINFDNPPDNAQKGLTFEWVCKDNPKNEDLCICCRGKNRRQQGPTLYLNTDARDYSIWRPLEYYGGTAEYNLTVTSLYGGKSSLLFIVSLSPKYITNSIFMNCGKNCFGISNCQESIILRTYTRNAFMFHRWASESSSSNGLNSIIASHNNRLQRTLLKPSATSKRAGGDELLEIPGGTLQSGDEVIIKATWSAEVGVTTLLTDPEWDVKAKIKCSSAPKLTGCTVNPIHGDGDSISSLFEVKCTYQISEDGGSIIAVYKRDWYSEYLLATSFTSPINVAVSHYHSNNTLVVKLIDVSQRQYDEVFLPVDSVQNVVPSDMTPFARLQSLKAVYLYDRNPLNESFSRLIKKQDYQRAVQLMHLIVGAIDNITFPENKTEAARFYELTGKHLAYLMRGLTKVEVHVIDDYYLFLGAVNHVLNLSKHVLTANVLSAAVTTTRRIANTFKTFWYTNVFKEKLRNDFASIIKYVMAIVMNAMANKMDDLKAFRPDPNVLTRRDDTFNYVDDSLILDPKYEEKLTHYQRISREGIDTLLDVSQIYGQEMYLGESLKTIHWQEDCMLSVARWQGNKLHEINYTESPATLNFDKNSFNVFKRTEVVIVIIKFINIDPLWWDMDRRYIRPPYLIINLYANQDKLPPVEGGIIIKFTFPPENMTEATGDFVVPENQQFWFNEIKNKEMLTHRVDVAHGTALLYKFTLECSEDQLNILDVVITVNRNPVIDDFDSEDVKQVNCTTQYLVERFPKEFLKYGDAWIYVAVLPSKAMSIDKETRAKLNVSYAVEFLTSGCMYWSFAMTKWIPHGCSAAGDVTDTQVECVCDHHSMFAPIVVPPVVTPIVYKPMVKFYIELQTCNIIYGFVLVSVFLYCCTLCLGFAKSQIVQKKVYYIGDNVIADRFAYMVCVKTGNYSNTTSSIGVKFIGSNATSRMHIINYPDPKFKLLRKDTEDWFVLASENYLGELTEVMLWHDSAGASPDWFCEHIAVVDLQTRQEYCFSIYKWLSVVLSTKRFLVIKVSSTLTEQLKTSNIFKLILRAIKDHVWYILQSFQDSDLSYTKRITLMLSIVLATFSFALCAYGVPQFYNFDGLDIGHIDFYPSIGIAAVCSGLGSFFVHLAYVMLFRKAYYRNLYTGETFLYKVGWTLLILTILATTTFLTLCGFFVGIVSSTLWCYSVFAAVIQVVVLFEGIYVVFRNLVFPSPERISERVKVANAVVAEAENQRDTLFAKFGDFLFRPQLKDKYRSLTNEEWRSKKQIELEKKNHTQRFNDATIYIPFLILFFLIAFFYRDSMTAISNNNIRDIVSGHTYRRPASLASVNNTEGLYAFITESLFKNAYTKRWYGMDIATKVKMMKGLDNIVLGAVRLRQQRLVDPCPIPSRTQKLNLTCFPTYTYSNLDQNDYTRGWGPNRGTASRVNPWRWAIDSMHISGKRSNYASGGYSIDLSDQKGVTYEMLESISTYNWIDKKTRLLVMEFLAYNANYNVFHFVNLVIEKTASGYYDSTIKIFSMRVFTTNRAAELLFYAEIAVFVILAVFFIFNVMKRILTRTSAIALWDVVDCLIIVLIVADLILFFKRLYLLMTFFHTMESVRPDEYINYYDLMYVGEQLFVVESLTLFFITFRIWKLLDFVEICGTCMHTLRCALPELLGVVVVHLIFLLSGSLMCYLIFGKNSNSFRDVRTSLVTMAKFTFDRTHLEYYDFWNLIGAIMIYFYTIVTLILFGFYFAIIRTYHSRCKKRDSGVVEFYSFRMYIGDYFGTCRNKIKKIAKAFRLKVSDEIPPAAKPSNRVYLKRDADRYADVVAVSAFDIQAMSLVARACLHNMGYKSKSADQSDLMSKILYHVGYREMVKEPRYLSFRSLHRDPSNMLVSDAKMVAMQRIVTGLLEKGEIEHEVDTSIKDDDDAEKQPQTLDEMLHAIKVMSRVISNISLVKVIVRQKKPKRY